MVRFLQFLGITLILGVFADPLAVAAATKDNQPREPTYLILDIKFELLEWNILGLYPRLHGRELLDRLARPRMEAAVEEFVNGRSVHVEDIDTRSISGWNEGMAILDRIAAVPLDYFDPDDPSDFFEDRQPDLSIGPVLRDLEYNGKPVDRAIRVTVTQLIIDRLKMDDFLPSASNRGSLMKVCTFDLDTGSLIWCAARQEDANLFDRYGVWRKDHYEKEVKALFDNPESTLYRRSVK